MYIIPMSANLRHIYFNIKNSILHILLHMRYNMIIFPINFISHTGALSNKNWDALWWARFFHEVLLPQMKLLMGNIEIILSKIYCIFI